jgi:single-strand DNA-binding protein
MKVIADEVAPSLRFATAKVTRAQRSEGGGGSNGGGNSGGNSGQNQGARSAQSTSSGGWGGNNTGNSGGWGSSDEAPF